MSRARHLRLLLAAALTAAPPGVHAQAVGMRLHGIVVDKETTAPLSDVEVSTMGGSPKALTDGRGAFTLAPVTTGAAVLLFRRLGYRAGSLTIERQSDDTTTVLFAMERVTQELSEVTVKAERSALTGARLAGFEERRAHGVGRFITEEEIERKGSMRTSDVLRAVLSIDVRATADGNTIVISRRGMKLQPGRGMPVECPIPVVVDGIMRIADLEVIQPKDIAGIEVYSGPGTTPQRYQSMSNYTQCGLVLIWTRGGQRPR